MVSVCKDSGLLPVDGTCQLCQKGNAVYEEYFIIGQTPSDYCTHHVALDICSTSGMIANANCTNTVKKVFIVGADPTTQDAQYIATEEFLATICTQHAAAPEPTPDTNVPDEEDSEPGENTITDNQP